MNVLMVGYGAVFSQNGYTVRIINEARLLKNVTKHLLVFVPPDDYKEVKVAGENADILESFSSDFKSVSVSPVRKYLFGFGNERQTILKSIADNKIDLIYAQSTSAGFIVAAARTSKPYILDLHGFSYYETLLRAKTKKRSALYTAAACLWAYVLDFISVSRATAITAVSDQMKSHLVARFSIDPFKIRTIPCLPSTQRNILDLEKWRMTRAAMRNNLEISENELVIGYAGGLGVYQMVEQMVIFVRDLASKRDAVKFLILALGDTSDLRQLIDDAGLTHRVCLLENIEHDSVYDYLTAMDFGLLLRKTDPVNAFASPTKFGEYLAAGLPVIVSKGIGDFDSFVEENNLGVLIDHSFSIDDEVIQSIDDFYDSRIESAENNISWVSREYNWMRYEPEFNDFLLTTGSPEK